MLPKFLDYYLFLSYRRRILDKNLNQYSNYFKGEVLDIGGGRERGYFKKPLVNKWLVVDIEKEFKPDVVADVHKLPFKDQTFDSIKATELLEHVKNPELAMKELARVLKKGGYLVISMPFLYPIHGDPDDYQRLTLQKLKLLAKENGFKVELSLIGGYYFAVLVDFVRSGIKKWILPLRWLSYIVIFPILEVILMLDKRTNFTANYPYSFYLILKK